MNVVHVIMGIARGGGGTSVFVADLAGDQAKFLGGRITILCSRPFDDPAPIDPAVRLLDAGSPPRLGEALRALALKDSIDVIHVHGIWDPPIHHACETAHRLGLPTIVATHGMLEPQALALKTWKKRAALALYQRRDLVLADMLHATAPREAAHLRGFGLRQPIVVAPPGIRLPEYDGDRHDVVPGPNVVLFFSRIHPIKNILGLIGAWAELRPPHWRLVIAGPDDAGHGAVVLGAIRGAGIADSVTFRGPVYGSEKDALFRSASLFVLPSFTENFGIVVLEAMSFGIPVITTTGTPWGELTEKGAGWYVAPDQASLTAALREATHRSPAELRAMGRRGRTIAAERYGSEGIVRRLGAAYRWAIGAGPMPDCVLT